MAVAEEDRRAEPGGAADASPDAEVGVPVDNGDAAVLRAAYDEEDQRKKDVSKSHETGAAEDDAAFSGGTGDRHNFRTSHGPVVDRSDGTDVDDPLEYSTYCWHVGAFPVAPSEGSESPVTGAAEEGAVSGTGDRRDDHHSDGTALDDDPLAYAPVSVSSPFTRQRRQAGAFPVAPYLTPHDGVDVGASADAEVEVAHHVATAALVVDDRVATATPLATDGGDREKEKEARKSRRRLRQVTAVALVLASALALALLALSLCSGPVVGGGVGGDALEEEDEAPLELVVEDEERRGTPPEAEDGTLDCSHGFAPVCGDDCWCGRTELDAVTGEPEACPDLPGGWVDACTPNLRELAAMYGTFELASVPDKLRDNRLPRLAAKPSIFDFREEDPLALPIFELPPTATTGGAERCDPYSYMTPQKAPSLFYGSTTGVIVENPYAGLPPCFYPDLAPPESVDSRVCAFSFPSNVTSVDDCKGRTYEMKTYSTSTNALEAGAHTTHFGGCGFCSDAKNLEAVLNGVDSFSADLLTCTFEARATGATRTPTETFQGLQQCLVQRMRGMSTSCAFVLTLVVWGSFLVFCSEPCAKGTDEIIGSSSVPFSDGSASSWMFGPPPQCQQNDCLGCVVELGLCGLSVVLGRIYNFSAVQNDLIAPCYIAPLFTVLPEIVHDPCDGLV